MLSIKYFSITLLKYSFPNADILCVCARAMSNSRQVIYWRNNNLLEQRWIYSDIKKAPPLHLRLQTLTLLESFFNFKLKINKWSAWMKKLIWCFAIWQFVRNSPFKIYCNAIYIQCEQSSCRRDFKRVNQSNIFNSF